MAEQLQNFQDSLFEYAYKDESAEAKDQHKTLLITNGDAATVR